MYKNRSIGEKMVIRLEFRNRCYLQVYEFWILCINVTIMCLCFTMCQQLLTVNLDVKLNRSKCNLSLEPKIMTVH